MNNPGATSLRYREQRPAADLAPFLECLWTVWDPRHRDERPSEHIVPDGCPELIVHLADPFSRQVDGRWRRQPAAFLAGTLSRPWTLRAGRRLRTFGIRFRAGCVTSILPVAMRQAADREVALQSLVGRAVAADLRRRLQAATGFTSRVRAAERWLRDRRDRVASGAAATRRDEVTRPAVELLLRDRGNERIDAVAVRLGVSRRALERAFARDLGIAPKLFARIVRLNAVLATLGGDERARMVDLAVDAGYFDQAHLLRDFRLVAGRRPAAHRDADGEMARHFTAPKRLLTLLAGE